MKNFVNFVNRNRKWFAISNVVITILFIFVPYYFFVYDSKFYTASLFDTVYGFFRYNQWKHLGSISSYPEIFTFIIIAAMITTTGLCVRLKKSKFILALPSFIMIFGIVFIILLKLSSFFITSYFFIAFYLALIVFVFYLTYCIADKKFYPKKEKPTNKERIAALEQELERLRIDALERELEKEISKLKKDDE